MDALNDAALASANAEVPFLPTVVSGFDSESEEALALRYGKAKKKEPDLVYEFTRDPALLHQYYGIFEREFRAVQNAQNFYWHHEDENERRGHFLIIRQGRQCVGGARLSVKTPRQPHLLPVEMTGFRIEDRFPEFKYTQAGYGQIGRVCLLPEFRSNDATTRKLFWHLHRKVVALGLDIVFAAAPIYNARLYRRVCMSMGIHTKIFFDIDLPPHLGHEELKCYLLTLTPNKLLINESFSKIFDEPFINVMEYI